MVFMLLLTMPLFSMIDIDQDGSNCPICKANESGLDLILDNTQYRGIMTPEPVRYLEELSDQEELG